MEHSVTCLILFKLEFLAQVVVSFVVTLLLDVSKEFVRQEDVLNGLDLEVRPLLRIFIKDTSYQLHGGLFGLSGGSRSFRTFTAAEGSFSCRIAL